MTFHVLLIFVIHRNTENAVILEVIPTCTLYLEAGEALCKTKRVKVLGVNKENLPKNLSFNQ